MQSNAAFEDLLPVPAREDVVMAAVRQVMGLAMAMSLLAVVIVLLSVFA
jgi:hypothetical protein